jgi:hypothetical protein
VEIEIINGIEIEEYSTSTSIEKGTPPPLVIFKTKLLKDHKTGYCCNP